MINRQSLETFCKAAASAMAAGLLLGACGSEAPPRAAAQGAAPGEPRTPDAPASAYVLDAPVRAADAEELRYYILKPLTDRFAEQNGISVTQAEKDAYVADVKAFLARDRAARNEPEPAPDTPADAAARQEMAAAFILQWKVNQALHRQYGGRIAYQQGGPEPVDAYRAFLEAQQSAGAFRILDEGLASGFWNYYRDDSRHSFMSPGSREESEAFASPPWSRRPAAPLP